MRIAICDDNMNYINIIENYIDFIFVTDSNQNNLQLLYLSRIESERDEYIYFGRFTEKYNPIYENNEDYFNELKEKYDIELNQSNVSIDVNDYELSEVNPHFYYSQKIKDAGAKFQAEYEAIDLLEEKNRELLSERMKNDIDSINCPLGLFVDCEAIYMRGIVIEQLNEAFQKDNNVQGQDASPYSNALPY